jgi:hydrogenase nickel incorporation protein HypB
MTQPTHQHRPANDHAAESGHQHDGQVHADPHDNSRLVQVEEQILAKNDHLAEHNRQWLDMRRILGVNLMGSPGSGKTTLLERTLAEMPAGRTAAVIEGDQETVFDAERVRGAGASVVQVNTGAGCHLDAAMVGGGLTRLDPPADSVLFVENVGNLVCPALFDLGEHAKVIIMSVTEGADKPMKYPQMFRAGTLVVLNKIDLLPYVDFEVDRFTEHLHTVNPHVPAVQLSATRGDGLPDWYAWLDHAAATLPGRIPAQS